MVLGLLGSARGLSCSCSQKVGRNVDTSKDFSLTYLAIDNGCLLVSYLGLLAKHLQVAAASP